MDTDFTRDSQLARLTGDRQPWDVIVIGGGATGAGIAVDAASRGYRVALFERHDFGKGTSSRSTKLIHGGVRYLQQGRIQLVRDALRERGLLCQNAPHLVHPLPTIVPLHSQFERGYYGFGLKIYEWLSGKWSLGPSKLLSLEQVHRAMPTIETRGLVGGVSYFDGTFDDSRLLINLVQTAIEHGAVCLNYAPVRTLVHDAGRVRGVIAEDSESGREIRVDARVVVNAAGPFSDEVQKLDQPNAEPTIAPSQGIHVVFDERFLPGNTALVVPKTRDGRVVFAIPWHRHTIVGTTDIPLERTVDEPKATPQEIEFLLETIAPYLTPEPTHADIRAVFAGIRPLVRGSGNSNTSKLGRDHQINVSDSGLMSIVGGKWTTYRHMAEDCVDRAATIGALQCGPVQLYRCRCTVRRATTGEHEHLAIYGSDAAAVRQLCSSTPANSRQLDPRLPYIEGEVLWAVRHEMARSVEDVLARRLRALFLDADAALASAPRVTQLLAEQLHYDVLWQTNQLAAFERVASNYRPT